MRWTNRPAVVTVSLAVVVGAGCGQESADDDPISSPNESPELVVLQLSGSEDGSGPSLVVTDIGAVQYIADPPAERRKALTHPDGKRYR